MLFRSISLAIASFPITNKSPSGVARILTSEGGITDPIVLAAALLHDTVEDTNTTIEEIEQEFGREVSSCYRRTWKFWR